MAKLFDVEARRSRGKDCRLGEELELEQDRQQLAVPAVPGPGASAQAAVGDEGLPEDDGSGGLPFNDEVEF
ncbi:hypothetical protein IMZ48_26120, partial [Candidatus Bathyarchaeota archaeon]|nr:hypothetical protein [Candidatus Bathyarchaeota archaeon]